MQGFGWRFVSRQNHTTMTSSTKLALALYLYSGVASIECKCAVSCNCRFDGRSWQEDHLDAHSFQSPFESSFEDSKGQSWLGDKASLLQEDSAWFQRHGIQEGGHLLLGSPHTISSRWMLMILQPARQMFFLCLYTQLTYLSLVGLVSEWH